MLNQGTYATRVLVGAVVWTVGIMFGTPVRGGFVDFNPTGNPAGQVFTIGGIDIAPGNALAVGAVNLAVKDTFQLYFQGVVAGLTDTKGLPFTPPGLNTAYQLTAVASFTEVVTGLSSNNTVADFSLAPVQSSNSFFGLFYNPNPVTFAKPLLGTGFNVGTPILLGKPSSTLPSAAVFTAQTGPPVAFDQFGGTNNYPGITTVSGTGTALSNAEMISFDPAFFKTPVNELSFNSLLATPFGQVDPSMSFAGMPGASPTIPKLGTINGVTGPDFQFEVDPNVSFTTAAIPEPTSIILAGLGFASIACLHAWMKK